MNLRHDPVIHDLNKHLAEIDEAEQYDLQAEAVMKRAEEIAREMLTQDGYQENGVTWGMSDVMEHIASNLSEAETMDKILAGVYDKQSRDAGLIFLEAFLERHAKAVAEDIAWREAG